MRQNPSYETSRVDQVSQVWRRSEGGVRGWTPNDEEGHTPEYVAELTERVKKSGTDWGARVREVKFSDRSKSRSMRLWTGDGMSESEDDE